MSKIITISREFGSGGRTIGKKLSERLGVECYDSRIIAETAKESGFTEEYVESQSEDTQGSGIFGWLAGSYYGDSNTHQIWNIQYDVIRDIASRGPCVIVGRCADYILHDFDNVLRVFIHADDEVRVKRILEEYGETDEEPHARLKEKDKKRKAYYEFITGNEWGKSTSFDLTLDSGTLGLDTCVDIIARAASED